MGFAEDVFAFAVQGVEAQTTKLASFASTTSYTPANMVPHNAVSSARPERRGYPCARVSPNSVVWLTGHRTDVYHVLLF